MTADERFDRLEHITAGIAEERHKDREEYKALWRDSQRQTNDLRNQVGALAVETRLRFEQVADRFDQLGNRMDKLATESHTENKALGEGIDQLVSAIGQLIAKG